MNVCMYSDDDKNLILFLPDSFSDDDIMSLGEAVFPYDAPDEYYDTDKKPVGCLNLYDMHATYPIDFICPDSVLPPSI